MMVLVFILDYFQENLIFQNISKNPKTPILGPFWALFAQIWAKINFHGKMVSVNFLIFDLPTTALKISKSQKTVGQAHLKPVCSID